MLRVRNGKKHVVKKMDNTPPDLHSPADLRKYWESDAWRKDKEKSCRGEYVARDCDSDNLGNHRTDSNPYRSRR